MTKHPTEYTFYTGLNTDLPALRRLLPRLDEELDGALGDVEEGRAARDERLLLHRRRRVHQEHDDRHRGHGQGIGSTGEREEMTDEYRKSLKISGL